MYVRVILNVYKPQCSDVRKDRYACIYVHMSLWYHRGILIGGFGVLRENSIFHYSSKVVAETILDH